MENDELPLPQVFSPLQPSISSNDEEKQTVGGDV
jgi:hypothetical protein